MHWAGCSYVLRNIQIYLGINKYVYIHIIHIYLHTYKQRERDPKFEREWGLERGKKRGNDAIIISKKQKKCRDWRETA